MMTQRRLLSLSCFIVTILIAIGCNTKGNLPKNWKIELNQNSKDPYGLYIAHEEIGNLSKAKIQDLEKLSEIRVNPSKASKYAVIVLSDETYFSEETKKDFDDLVKNGGIVMIADYQDNTADTIYTNTLTLEDDFELTTNETFKINKKRRIEHHYFETFDHKYEVLGSIQYNDKSFPNLLKNQPKNAKGFYLFHAEPLYFTNYYLLNQDSYFYIKSVLQQLKGRTIIWYNPHKTYASSNTSTMRFVLSQPALQSAWILLLVLLFIFLIFRSRREQRIIPIYEKEENHTVEFAKTISALYHENGEVKDIVAKKIDYFLYKIRKNFLIETDNLNDKNFIEIVAQKANYTQEECSKIFETLYQIKNKEQPTQHDLKIVYQIIENYKQKANI